MGIAKDFNKVLHDQIRIHAAWLPVTNTFQLGDFGVISDGVFVRMGNIQSDFGVTFDSQAGTETKLDFKSDRVRVFRFAGNAEVPVFPGESVDASLKIEFGKEKSFYLKAALSVSQMASVFAAAQQLSDKPRWDTGKFKVISAVYTGRGCAILSSREGNASVEITGKADALKKLEMGSAEAGLSFSSRSGMGLEILGDNGVVGLQLFKVEKNGQPGFEAAREPFSTSADWAADLEDDL
jgi:hypothetical protein